MTVNLFDIANSDELRSYVNKNLYDPWQETPFRGYSSLSAAKKGNYGEEFVEKYFKIHNRTVKPPKTDKEGHDRIIDGFLTEIKFSLAQTDYQKKQTKINTFMLNHVSLEKDWERLVFFGINPETHKSYTKFITKDDFKKLLDNKTEFFTYFSTQQGGKKSANDDYMSSGKKLIKLLESPYMKDISEWFDEEIL